MISMSGLEKDDANPGSVFSIKTKGTSTIKKANNIVGSMKLKKTMPSICHIDSWQNRLVSECADGKSTVMSGVRASIVRIKTWNRSKGCRFKRINGDT